MAVDYAALASQYGGTSTPAPAAPVGGNSQGIVDYNALAQKFGAITQAPAPVVPQPQLRAATNAVADVGIGAGKAALGFVGQADVLGTMNRLAKGDTSGFGQRASGLLDAANPLGTMHRLAGDNSNWTGVEPVQPSQTPDWSGISPAQREQALQPSNYAQKVGQTGAIVAANLLPIAHEAAPVINKVGAAVTDAAQGAVDSAVGGVRSGLGSAKNAVTSKITSTTNKLMGNEPTSIIANRVKELTRLEDSSSAVRAATAKAQGRGIDSKNILAQTDLLHGAVDNTGTIRTQNAIHELNDFIKPQEDVISKNLQREGVKLPISTVKKSLSAAVDKSSLEGEALDNAHAKVDREIAGLSRRADQNGNVFLAKIHDAKVNKYATLDYMNEGSKMADKTIARTYKTLVEKNTKSTDVKALNDELSSHFSVLNLLEKLDGKKVDGGKLGKYFAQTVGAVVGGHFGPLGSIAGAEIAGRLKGAAMAQKLSGKTGAGLEQSAAMKAAVEQGKQPPLMLPPGRGTGFGNQTNNVPIPMGSGFTMEKSVPKPDYSNSLGNLNQAQTPTTIATKSANIPESVPQPAVKAIQDHLTSAQQVFDNLPAEKTNISDILERTKTNIADGLASQGYKDIANHVRTFVTTSFKSLADFTKALWDHIKTMHQDESGKIKLPFGSGKKPTAALGNAQTYAKEAASFMKKNPSQSTLSALHDFLQHYDTKQLPSGETTSASFTSKVRNTIHKATGLDTFDWTDNKLARFATAIEDHVKKLDTKHSIRGVSKMPLLPINP